VNFLLLLNEEWEEQLLAIFHVVLFLLSVVFFVFLCVCVCVNPLTIIHSSEETWKTTAGRRASVHDTPHTHTHVHYLLFSFGRWNECTVHSIRNYPIKIDHSTLSLHSPPTPVSSISAPSKRRRFVKIEEIKQ
jgi:hypothetical protein